MVLRTSNSLITLENALSDLNFDVSKQIVNFWNNLYDDANEMDISYNTLHVGSLIHCDNYTFEDAIKICMITILLVKKMSMIISFSQELKVLGNRCFDYM
jgi:hypothetical protein